MTSFTVSTLTTIDLLGRPETGMGFQIVDLDDAVEGARFVLVENATIARTIWDLSEATHFRLSQKSSLPDRTERLVREAVDRREFATLTHSAAANYGIVQFKARDGNISAAEAEQTQSLPDERFLRFSVVENDLRIQADGSLLRGTYATTYLDGITFVKTGMDAVRRYALPDTTPASHRFYLKPPERVVVRRGTVTAANGQPGGGAEVLFDNGAPARTRYHHDTLPPGE